MESSVLVIGAGLAGLACARTLREAGCSVRVVDKGRGIGGRLATRRADSDRGPLAFDHGAQYFTARDPRFRRQVDAWVAQGSAAPWNAKVTALGAPTQDFSNSQKEPTEAIVRYVGVPAMNTVAKSLAEELDVQLATQITRLSHTGRQWTVWDGEDREMGRANWLIVAIPAPQARELLAPWPVFAQRLTDVRIAPCWATLVAFPDRLPLEWDGAFVNRSSLSWVARNSSKPGRSAEPECWVLHAAPVWSMDRLEDAPEAIGPRLLAAFWQAAEIQPVEPTFLQSHRWRYALPTEPLVEPYLLDDPTQLAVCGDWCAGPRVEGAYLSGLVLAEALLKRLS